MAGMFDSRSTLRTKHGVGIVGRSTDSNELVAPSPNSLASLIPSKRPQSPEDPARPRKRPRTGATTNGNSNETESAFQLIQNGPELPQPRYPVISNAHHFPMLQLQGSPPPPPLRPPPVPLVRSQESMAPATVGSPPSTPSKDIPTGPEDVTLSPKSPRIHASNLCEEELALAAQLANLSSPKRLKQPQPEENLIITTSPKSPKQSKSKNAKTGPSPKKSTYTLRQPHISGKQLRPLKQCNCRNSKCLKLYCECFRARVYCQDCNCIGCHNTIEFASEVQQAVDHARERNPTAFEPKISADGEVKTKVRHNRGCKCSKTGCLKNYCECFQAGITCSDNCKCIGCKNFEGGKERETLLQEKTTANSQRLTRQQQHKRRQDKNAYVQFGFPSPAYSAPVSTTTSVGRVSKPFMHGWRSPQKHSILRCPVARNPQTVAAKAVFDKINPDSLMELIKTIAIVTRDSDKTRNSDSKEHVEHSSGDVFPNHECSTQPNLSSETETLTLTIIRDFLTEVTDHVKKRVAAFMNSESERATVPGVNGISQEPENHTVMPKQPTAPALEDHVSPIHVDWKQETQHEILPPPVAGSTASSSPRDYTAIGYHMQLQQFIQQRTPATMTLTNSVPPSFGPSVSPLSLIKPMAVPPPTTPAMHVGVPSTHHPRDSLSH